MLRRAPQGKDDSDASDIDQQGPGHLAQQIREKFGLKPASKLDFELLPDGTVKLRPAHRTALSIMGMLKRPGQWPVSIEDMDEGIAALLERKHGRKRR